MARHIMVMLQRQTFEEELRRVLEMPLLDDEAVVALGALLAGVAAVTVFYANNLAAGKHWLASRHKHTERSQYESRCLKVDGFLKMWIFLHLEQIMQIH